MIGEGAAVGTIFRGRVPLAPNEPLPPTDDHILTRILWLDGREAHNANTQERFIDIHGTKHEDRIGGAADHGGGGRKSGEWRGICDGGVRVTSRASAMLRASSS